MCLLTFIIISFKTYVFVKTGEVKSIAQETDNYVNISIHHFICNILILDYHWLYLCSYTIIRHQ